MMRKLANRKGFTLVELMIVVAIIGILAAIAIPNFLNFRLKAKTSEAKSNLGAIRSLEIAHYAEWDVYVGNQTATPIAARANDPQKAAWVAGTHFSILGFEPEGDVYFSYTLEGADIYQNSGFSSEAEGDLDDNGAVSTYRISDDNTDLTHSGDAF